MAARPPFMSSPESSPGPPPVSSPSSQRHAGPRDILDLLLRERAAIHPLRMAVPNLWSLLEAEIARLSAAAADAKTAATLSSLAVGLARTSSVPNALIKRPSAPPAPRKRVKIPVPADRYPEYNFVGRLLGPRGTTLKTLERDTGCKIMIRGKGSIRKDKEPDVRGKPGWEHVFNEALHVVIEVGDALDDAAAARALSRAKDAVELLLVPVPEERDGLKRQQLRALAIMNGTYRGGPSRSHDQLPISSYAGSPPPHSSSPYLSIDTASTPMFLGDSMAAPLSSPILGGYDHPLDDQARYRYPQYPSHDHVALGQDMNRNSGRRSPSSGATSPNTFEAANEHLSVPISKAQRSPVDEFASSSVGDDSPESSPSSEEGEPSTHIIGSAFPGAHVKVSSLSTGSRAETSLGVGGFIGQEFYNGAFSNGASRNPWAQASAPQSTTENGSVPASSSSALFGFSSIPSPQVLTTSTTTVTPIDRHGGC